MTHQEESTRFTQLVQVLSEEGFDGMAQALEILLNEAMKIERSEALGAEAYQRTDSRRGYANGFKPKLVHTRVGELNLSVPQTRGVEFYPSALERGVRSERALKLAVAEMYVQGVSTRKVAQVTRELCGLDVSSSQVCPFRDPHLLADGLSRQAAGFLFQETSDGEQAARPGEGSVLA